MCIKKHGLYLKIKNNIFTFQKHKRTNVYLFEIYLNLKKQHTGRKNIFSRYFIHADKENDVILNLIAFSCSQIYFKIMFQDR